MKASLLALSAALALLSPSRAGDAVVWCPETGKVMDGFSSNGTAAELVPNLLRKLRVAGGVYPTTVYQSDRTGFVAIAKGKRLDEKFCLGVGDGDTQEIADAMATADLRAKFPDARESKIVLRHRSNGSGSHVSSDADLRAAVAIHDEKVRIALDPLVREHAARLQTLLKSAQEAGNRQAALETLVELRKLGPAAVQYAARVTFEFSAPNEVNAEQALRNHLPNDPFISSLTQVRSTGLFELTVVASDPQFAAGRANDLIASLGAVISQLKFAPIKVLERAEPPTEPLAAAQK